MNAAYSKHYESWRQECERVFRPEYLCPHREGQGRRELAGGFELNIDFYEGEVSGRTISGSECELSDPGGNICCRWRNLDNSGEFFTVLHHSNGQSYLLFRRDLYGYSVLDLQSMAEFHYIPDRAFPEDEKDFKETFIWTDAVYNPQNNLMAVSGCLWACPFSVIVLDFSSPMTENEVWAELHEAIDDGYDIYDDIEFAGWESDGSLTVRGYNNNTSETDTLVFKEDRLREMIGRKRL